MATSRKARKPSPKPSRGSVKRRRGARAAKPSRSTLARGEAPRVPASIAGAFGGPRPRQGIPGVGPVGALPGRDYAAEYARRRAREDAREDARRYLENYLTRASDVPRERGIRRLLGVAASRDRAVLAGVSERSFLRMTESLGFTRREAYTIWFS